MIISKTPFRISFFGGGTDYPEWYLKEGGAVLSTTIDKYCYITCRVIPPFFDLKHRIVWSHIEAVHSISEILHPAVRVGLQYMGFDDSKGLEIHYQGDLPARAGMGSSSSFVVGLINVLKAMRRELIGRHELALRAIELEQNVLKENVGSQDQIAVAYGGFNTIYFKQNGEIRVEPILVSPSRIKELESHLLLVYTGTSRLSSQLAKEIIVNLHNRREHLKQIRAYVDDGMKILYGNGSIEEFGELLGKMWNQKKQLSSMISNPNIDMIYQTAKEHGAIGGKLLGAGSTGFMLLFVPPEKQESVIHSLSGYLHVPFLFEHDGSSLVYYKPEE